MCSAHVGVDGSGMFCTKDLKIGKRLCLETLVENVANLARIV